MSPTHFTVKSLSGKIFTSVLAFTLCMMLVFAAAMTTIYYLSYERDAENELSASAQDAATYLNASPTSANIPALREQFAGLVRYTLIAPDGTVLYDSAVDASGMENHADRPEVREADTVGEAAVMRHSETLGADTVYAAVKLDDGSIIRLSESRHSLLAFLGSMLVPVVVALVVAAVMVFVLSKTLTRRIMKPIDALNFADPLENEIYEEMDPLLIRIDEQQRRLLQQNRELAQAENMRRDFSSNVSHEMKTPLQVISGYAELMKNDMVQPADRQKFAGLIYEEAQAMRSLINDVLTLSRLDESAFHDDPALINLHAVAERVAGRLGSFAAEHNVEVRIEGNTACIAGSETLAEEMLYNLIENGIRYNHEGGSVVMSVGVEQCFGEEYVMPPAESETAGHSPAEGSGSTLGSPAARASANAANTGDAAATDAGRAANAGATTNAPGVRKQTVVRVSDTGPGIPEDLRDKVFERFFRVDKSRSKETGGTGLGLAIVKHAVIHHGGTIEVKSVEGAGTTFILRFPTA